MITGTITVTPQQPADAVAIARVEYTVAKNELRVEATSSSTTATLNVFVTATNERIGTLTNLGGGKYGGQFIWPVNPQNITVRSNLGGTATAAVVAK